MFTGSVKPPICQVRLLLCGRVHFGILSEGLFALFCRNAFMTCSAAVMFVYPDLDLRTCLTMSMEDAIATT